VPVISTDFFPTILEMVGLPLQPKQHADGVSIAELVKGAGTLDRKALFWHFPHYSNHGMQSPGGAVRAGDYKLLEYFENNTVQLFNLKKDIGEQNDLSETEPEKVAELRTLLKAWRKDVYARMMVPNPNYVPGKAP
jgi:arylsulfatase A-like enzyme